ncbi:MAG: phytoene desaturase family protein [Candidatus Roizmanbacteria bacterium]
MNTKKVVVIGGGIAGLSTAALLAKDGLQVTLLERNATLGGRGRVLREKGFTFDMGPSWYMMPDVFEDYFKLFGQDISHYLNLVRLPVHYKIFFPQNKTYEISKDLENNLDLFEKNEPNGREKLKSYLAKSKYLYDTAMHDLVFQDYQSYKPFLSFSLLSKLFTLDIFRSFHDSIKSQFSNPHLQKILEFTTVFLGGSPYNTPAFYSLISHTDFNMGIFYPMGGMGKIFEALEMLCKENGVDIQTNQDVSKICVENGAASKVMTTTGEYDADIVVSSADYHFSETRLLESKWQTYPESYWQKKVLSPSAFVMYLGLNTRLKNISHHNLYFEDSWEKHFNTVYGKSSWPEKPSFYFHCPSVTDQSVAPQDGETLMVLVPVAAGLEDTDEIREKYYLKIIQSLETILGEKISDKIVMKKIFAHTDFSQAYNAYKGSAFGIAHTLFQTALFRPLNQSAKVRNLYYSGQYTNPGVGLPVCLISAQIVRNAIMKQEVAK